MSNTKQTIQEILEKHGVYKAGRYLAVLNHFGGVLNVPPGLVARLLAEAPQEDLDRVQTPRQALALVMAQYAKMLDTVFARAEAEQGDTGAVDVSFAKEFFAAGEQQAKEGGGYAAPNPDSFLVPGTDTLQ